MTKNKLFLFILLSLLTLAGLFLLLRRGNPFSRLNTIEMSSSVIRPSLNDKTTTESNADNVDSQKTSPLSGLACVSYDRRSLAVMLASDAVARPLSGLTQADMVFEMPVVVGSITRLMAVYICGSPSEIGSVRSSRHDFIPLADGLDAIYVHWGGSHFALDLLNKGVIDNLDALKNPYGAFFRKQGIAPPQNGFSSTNRLLGSADKLGYGLKNNFSGYPHQSAEAAAQSLSGALLAKSIKIGYARPFDVEWRYDDQGAVYGRWRGGTKEMDKNNGQQVSAKNIVVMKTVARELEGQYNDVDVEGDGQAYFFLSGKMVEGKWQKKKGDFKSKLYFFDMSGKEIEFIPGAIWVEIVPLEHQVSWH